MARPMDSICCSPPESDPADCPSLSPSLYWYDLETSGVNPRWDRIVQFAGLRTDYDLNEIGDTYCTYVKLPDDVLARLKELSEDVVTELAGKNPDAKKIYSSYDTFRKQVMAWHEISEKIYFNVR